MTEDILLKPYAPTGKAMWDQFVNTSKNGLFLFCRDFMEYHASRFQDHSLIAYCGQTPVALLPANRDGATLHTHQGLTFGGWLTDSAMKTTTMLTLFSKLVEHLHASGIAELHYKCIPHIYHHIPAEEDRYALFRHNATLHASSVTAVIDTAHAPGLAGRRQRGIRKAAKSGIAVKETTDYPAFFAMLENLLDEKFATKPTHSLQEMQSLAVAFPQNIRLFAAFQEADMLAGCIIFESAQVAHVQYIASTPEGRLGGALDAVFDELLHRIYAQKRYFDFGTSNERGGQFLNEGLISQKEEFGARAVEQATYLVRV